jgi:adenosylcobinamide-GDP ribazoletransferase
MKLLRTLAGGIGFLTIAPLSFPVEALSVLAFPLAGGIVAALIVGVRVLAHPAGPLVVGALAVAADVVATRGLHYDALCDTADGLGGFMDAERRLGVMDDPHVGAFGVLALVVIVVVRLAVFASPQVSATGLVLALAWSRSLMGVVLLESPRARPGGMTRWFQAPGEALRVASVLLLVGLSLGVVLVEGLPGLLGVALGTIVGGLLWLRAHRELGGVTGDVVGAVGLLAETALIVGVVVGGAL